MTVCRFGILGAATIARKNWKAIRLSGNARVTAEQASINFRCIHWRGFVHGVTPLTPLTAQPR